MKKCIELLSVSELTITDYGTIQVTLRNDTSKMELFDLLSAKGATTRCFFLKGMLPKKPQNDTEKWDEIPENATALVELSKRLVGQSCNVVSYTFEISELYTGKTKVTISGDVVTTSLIYSEPTTLTSVDEITTEMIDNAKSSILAANERRADDMVFE